MKKRIDTCATNELTRIQLSNLVLKRMYTYEDTCITIWPCSCGEMNWRVCNHLTYCSDELTIWPKLDGYIIVGFNFRMELRFLNEIPYHNYMSQVHLESCIRQFYLAFNTRTGVVIYQLYHHLPHLAVSLINVKTFPIFVNIIYIEMKWKWYIYVHLNI